MRPTKTQRSEIGRLGEELVYLHFKKNGIEVKYSDDEFDSEKDLLINGETSEVKTQTVYQAFPFPQGKEPAFTVSITNDDGFGYRNQLSKCLNVQRLFFVARPTIYNRVVKIYEAPTLGKRFFTVIKNSGDQRYVAGFPLNKAKLLASYENEKIIKGLL